MAVGAVIASRFDEEVVLDLPDFSGLPMAITAG